MVKGLTNSLASSKSRSKAQTPPNITRHSSDPTTRDYFNFSLGDLWLNNGTNSAPLYRLWVLESLRTIMVGNLPSPTATWVLLTNGANGAVTQLTASDATIALPVLGNITFPDQVIAGSGNVDSNLQSNVNPNLGFNFTINLKPAIRLPVTNAALTQGVIYIGVNRFIHGYGTANTFIGNASGNNTLTVLTASQETAVGNGTLIRLTTGSLNTTVGANSQAWVTTGSSNTSLGASCFGSLFAGVSTGSNNIGIGAGAGTNYTGAEDSNILVGNQGTLGESNTIRVGTNGGGATQQNRCFIAGIRGVTTGVNDAVAVLIDSAHQLGTVSSSERYKQNITDMGDQSEIVYRLRPVLFNYKKFPTAPAWGLIAEEVDQVFPQLVVYNEEGQPDSVKYHELVPLLLNEIKSLNNRLKQLEEKECVSSKEDSLKS